MEAALSSRVAATFVVIAVSLVAAGRDRDRTPVHTVTELVSVVNYTPTRQPEAQEPAEAPEEAALALASGSVTTEPVVVQAAAAQPERPAPEARELVMATAVQAPQVTKASTAPVAPAPRQRSAAAPRAAKPTVLARTCTAGPCRHAQHKAAAERKPPQLQVVRSDDSGTERLPRFLVPVRNFGLYLQRTLNPRQSQEQSQAIAAGR
jgi:hypothetical protein